MTTLLMLGFFIGMRHALEADHVAAVASLATGARSVGETVRQGAAWGLGHTLTLFLFGSVVLLMDTVIPERVADGLEFAVGLMLVVLGADVLRRLKKQRVHFHVHRHADGVAHFHAHSHAGEQGPHDPDHHHHEHTRGFPLRALAVGLMHGMAGSAALILLTLQTVQTPLTGLAYMALFGIGSIAGMAALSAVIAVPMQRTARSLASLHGVMTLTVGVITLGLGLYTAIPMVLAVLA
ncbi:MAG TPA: urease accessory protein [Thiotrichales bacterium]|nr:urease accessory protein [Thiotrichales bacterium]